MVETKGAFDNTTAEAKVGDIPVRDEVDVRFIGDYVPRGCGAETKVRED